ncbi:MAG: M48 family metalloprotease, partial [Solirubrobacterales bacterium]|nr:M48 family metalloprotease [Solirubrobacterales bacterium]
MSMLVVAELAFLALSPAGYEFEPQAVPEQALLGGERLDEARELGSDYRALYGLGLLCQAALLLALALGRPRAAERLWRRLDRRPALGSIAAGALLWIAISLVALPASLLSHERAVEAGISIQDLGSWLYDFALGTAIGTLLAALALGLLASIWRRLGSRWWIPAGLAVVAISAAYVWLSPILLGPAFNDFRELPDGDPVRADVIRLAERADVEVGEVLSVDASRRGRSLNAYVGGLGATKQVVIYDNLLSAAQRAELRSVLGHELGHVAAHDLARGLGFIAIVAPLGLLFAGLLARALVAGRRIQPGSPASLPALLLAIGLAVTVLG